MIRQIWLENELGERQDLTDINTCYLNEPNGFGFVDTIEYEMTDDGFQAISSKYYEKPSIAGTLLFSKIDGDSKAYDRYREISNWIIYSKDLRLGYKPYNGNEYFMDVKIDVLEKTELGVGFLECPIQISGLTPWYAKSKLILEFTGEQVDNLKRYDYRYSYVYGSSSNPGSVEFIVNGHFDGGISFFANGPLLSPKLTLKEIETGKVIGRVDLSSENINANEQLVYLSNVKETGIWKKKNNQLIDLIDKVELQSDIKLFMRAPINTQLEAQLEVDNTITSQATLYIDEYWKTR